MSWNCPQKQAIFVLYFAIAMAVAILMICIALMRNSLSAISNANYIQLKPISDSAATDGLKLVQSFIYEDMKTSD
ncbi:MAG: hypothetical protein SVC26_02715 [Pseudomonadota bacterium]|nr:hypothetical protein [Pseudomonadota bacterium]